jgi:signal transduction histidine kinase
MVPWRVITAICGIRRFAQHFKLLSYWWVRDGSLRVDTNQNRQHGSSLFGMEFVQQSLDAMSQGISVAKVVNGELHIVLCNEQFIKLLGFPAEFADLPRPFTDFIRYNAERGEYGPGDIDQQINERVELAKQFLPHAFQRIRPDGTVIEIVGKPLPSNDGFVTTYTDTTEREQAETYSDLLIQALDRSGAGIAIFDPDDTLVLTNRTIRSGNPFITGTVMQGFGYEDWGRALVRHGMLAGIKDREDAWLEKWNAHRYNAHGSMEVERSDGQWRLVEVVILRSGHTVMVSSDITELKKAQMALITAKEDAELANRAKTDFLANMSHELRTPLNSIIGFSELLISTDFETLRMGSVNEYLTDINRSGRHLLRLISDILDISKIEVGELKLDEEELCLRELSEECLRMISERARRAGTRITNQDRPPKVRLFADETRVKQIILNLLTNAIKFTDSGGQISFGWQANDDGSISLDVTDTGSGMAEENIRVALEPFGQVANSMTREHEGAGLGLPLSRRLAELHQAELSIKSNLGEGTTVLVTFPKDRVITNFEP